MKNRTLRNLDTEIVKDIGEIIDLCRRATFLELSYFIYLIHLVRIRSQYPEDAGHSNPDLVRVTSLQLDETLKYLIQCVVKYGDTRVCLDRSTDFSVLNTGLVRLLIGKVNVLNAKYETRSLVDLFDVETVGESDRHSKIDLNRVDADSDIAKLFDYFTRLELDNQIKKESRGRLDDLLASLEEAYQFCRDLFEVELGVSLETFLEFNRYVAGAIAQELESLESQFPLLPNGNVNVDHPKSFLLYTLATQLSIDTITTRFGTEVLPLMERLSFDPSKFDEFQLRYHHTARAPLIRRSEHYLQVCPELVLDSLFINVHYSLLESNSGIHEEYKARSSAQFVNRIASACSRFGYREVCRELELREGKRDLGDVDLVMRSSQNSYLLIEAKNHALPLDVYFKGVEATVHHLDYLRQRWEKPVETRVAHLEEKALDYGISGPFQYITVSRFPEIISHYSDHLVLSVQELEPWLQTHPNYVPFSELYHRVYGRFKQQFSTHDLEELRQRGFIIWEALSPENGGDT